MDPWSDVYIPEMDPRHPSFDPYHNPTIGPSPEYEVIVPPGLGTGGGDGASGSFTGGSFNATQDFSEFVTACKCDSAQSFTCNNNVLFPNDELAVCIRSLSEYVRIDYLDSVRVQQGDTDLSVIQNDQVDFPAITYREYVPGANGVAVSTRVPANIFNFALGQSIAVSGGIVVRLAGSDERRRLNVELQAVQGVGKAEEGSGRDLQASGANAGFRINVELAEDGDTVPVATINAAVGVANGGFVVLGTMIFSYAFAMM
jgi:hypothetical protein